MGEPTGKVYDEGWYWVTPFVKKVVNFDLKSQLNVVLASAASSDLQDVEMELAVQYRIEGNDIINLDGLNVISSIGEYL